MVQSPPSKMKPEPDKDEREIKIKNISLGSTAAEAEGAPLAPPSPIELVLRIFCADSVKRMEGRPGFAIPVAYKNTETKVSQKMYSIHLIHQIFVGSVGGVACGIETGYISFDRLPTPNTPFPPSWGGLNSITQASLRNGSVMWNTGKRAVVAGLLFDLLDKNIEEARGTRDWLNFSMAGFISGAIFGLRGGTHGLFACSLGFGFFGGLAGFFANFGKRGQEGDGGGRGSGGR